jgi:hypothetical protein
LARLAERAMVGQVTRTFQKGRGNPDGHRFSQDGRSRPGRGWHPGLRRRVLHPQGPDGNGSYHATIAGMLSDPKWPAAHWFALVSLAVTAWAVGMLIDTGVTSRSTVAQIGARLL